MYLAIELSNDIIMLFPFLKSIQMMKGPVQFKNQLELYFQKYLYHYLFHHYTFLSLFSIKEGFDITISDQRPSALILDNYFFYDNIIMDFASIYNLFKISHDESYSPTNGNHCNECLIQDHIRYFINTIFIILIKNRYGT